MSDKKEPVSDVYSDMEAGLEAVIEYSIADVAFKRKRLVNDSLMGIGISVMFCFDRKIHSLSKLDSDFVAKKDSNIIVRHVDSLATLETFSLQCRDLAQGRLKGLNGRQLAPPEHLVLVLICDPAVQLEAAHLKWIKVDALVLVSTRDQIKNWAWRAEYSAPKQYDYSEWNALADARQQSRLLEQQLASTLAKAAIK